MKRRVKPSMRKRRIAWVLSTATLLGTAILGKPTYAQENQNFENVEIQVLPVQGNVYMIAGSGGNITLQVGQQGVFLVDTGYEQLSDKILAAIRKISDKQIFYIIDTNVDPDHIGGNEKLRQAGITLAGGLFQSNADDAQPGAPIIAHENVFNRMNGRTGGKAPWPSSAWPTDSYFTSPKKLYFNDEGIEIFMRLRRTLTATALSFFAALMS
jgi:glyoxylase-like metal-dependent hydrolase (beta-lactamase superfamily II)